MSVTPLDQDGRRWLGLMEECLEVLGERSKLCQRTYFGLEKHWYLQGVGQYHSLHFLHSMMKMVL